jgi:hypothetical protein
MQTKEFETTLNVVNPINFCTNKSGNVLTMLQNAYVGRCYMGAFIQSIVSVEKVSACKMVKTNGSGDAYVDVSFRATIAVFSTWDILVGVRVVSRGQMVHGVYEAPAAGASPAASVYEAPAASAKAPAASEAPARAAVTLLAAKGADTVAIGQLVAVRVIMASHEPMQPQASVVATLLTCDTIAPVYKLRGALEPAAAADLRPLLERIHEELRRREAGPSAAFFEGLLLAHRRRDGTAAASEATVLVEGAPAWRGPAPLVETPDTQNVLDIVGRALEQSVPVTGVWSRPLSLHRSSPLAACVKEGPLPPGWGAPVSANAQAVFAGFLRNILDFLVATRELATVYGTPELIAQHHNIWAAMRAEQKTL